MKIVRDWMKEWTTKTCLIYGTVLNNKSSDNPFFIGNLAILPRLVNVKITYVHSEIELYLSCYQINENI